MINDRPSPLTISVVIPAYNAAKFIRETLESVLAQTYPPVEILVIDDGSTDQTADVVRSFGEKVQLLQQENRGESAARNRGIRKAKGEYIAFIDADDLWLPKKLELQTECIFQKKVAWVSCAVDHFDDHSGKILTRYRKKLYEGDVLEKLFLSAFIASPTPVIKKSVFEEVGYFDEAYEARIGEDWDMWMRIAARYPVGMVYQILALKRDHPASQTGGLPMQEKLRLQVQTVERAVAREPDKLGALKNKEVAKLYLNSGTTLLKRDQYDQARPLICISRKLNPFSLKTAFYWLVVSTGKMGTQLYRLYRRLKTRMV